MEEEYVTTTIKFLKRHITFLKTIDNNNLSGANRKALDRLIDQKKNIVLEKYMLLFAMGLMVIVFSLGSVFIAVQLAVGVCFIVYSVVALFLWRLNREIKRREG